MKIILLRLKMFFTDKATRRFLLIFFVSLFFSLGGMYFFQEKIQNLSEENQEELIKETVMELIAFPRSTNITVTVEQSTLLRIFEKEVNTNIVENKNFWTGDALQYRYTLPQQGLPKP